MSRGTSTIIRATTATSTRTTTPKPRSDRPGAALLAAVVAASLFAFGGAYSWTTVPLFGIAVALVLVVRPRIHTARQRLLDTALIAAVAIAALQLVPLPRTVRYAVAPAFQRLDDALYLDSRDATAHRPLTVDPPSTREAVMLACVGVLIFFSARTLFAGRGTRIVLRAVSICGLVASGLAIVQHAVSPLLLYGIWRPLNRSASPYTPFVNRNDLAAWLILAIPLAAGYALTRLEARRSSTRAPLTTVVDDTTFWLMGAIAGMIAALMVSVSRAGLTGGAAAGVCFLLLSRGRLSTRGQLGLVVAMAIAIGAGSFYVAHGSFLTRIEETIASGVGGRAEIWQVTRAMIGDFPVTGVGVGAYARAATVYQPPHEFSFNHAHSEYLQVVAEGGLTLAAIVTSGLPKPIRQTNISFSRRGTIRGLHYHERGQDDLFVCLQGRARVVALDRDTGETFSEDIGDDNFAAVFVPGNLAHGFEALTDVLMLYHVSEEYDAGDPDEHEWPWDDPRVVDLWSTRSPILSERDSAES